ncbi:MAG: lytic murein transglycosylase B [Gammaproteobacteria bacterium]|nr:lytic murein transglycosylase B [Gammaproteobacteria bacterium]
MAADLATDPAAVQAFIDKMHQQHGKDKAEVARLLAQARHQQEILDSMNRRAEKHKAGHEYMAIFMTQSRIDKGVAFWSANRELLEKAEREFGVPAQVIVAILGVETIYGERTGSMRVLDALYTLAFNYPKRAEFFSKELMQFILLAEEANFDPTQVTGSYAGAMGAAQFISSSYRHYAIDYDKDGHTDLWKSPADMIGSIANYLKLNGWQAQDPVAAKRHQGLMFAEPGRALKEVVLPTDKPQHSLKDLAAQGVLPASPIQSQSPAYLLAFERADGSFDYWLGLHNFYVITRYNRSPLYAMAVYQLGEAIRQQRQASADPANPPTNPPAKPKETPFVFH